MSREDVEVVRRATAPHDGEDWASGLQTAFAALDHRDADAPAAWMARDPGLRHTHPDIVWDVGAIGAIPPTYHGLAELAAF
jgi:hypothetical protein